MTTHHLTFEPGRHAFEKTYFDIGFSHASEHNLYHVGYSDSRAFRY